VLTNREMDKIRAALALERSGQVAEAEQIYRDLLVTKPANADVLQLAGNAARVRANFDEAIELLERAAAVEPGAAEVQCHLADAFAARGDTARAVEHYERALELNEGLLPATIGLGHALRKLGQLDAATLAFRRAIDLQPDNADMHLALGGTLRELGMREAAAVECQRATELDPASADAQIHLGHALHELGQSSSSIAAFRRAVELRPDAPEAFLHLGNALFLDGHGAEAAAENFRRALELRPDFTNARFNLALTQLACGNLTDGWKDFELRFDEALGPQQVPRFVFSQPAWEGEDLSGKSLLVWGEQGLGDQIQFASLLPELIERARQVTVVCLPKLLPLFARSFPTAVVTAQMPAGPAADFDFHCAAGNAARWLRPLVDSFPGPRGYLKADPSRVAYWRERVGAFGTGPTVGFSWRSRNQRGDRVLWCTLLDDWLPLFHTAGVNWVCLQYDDCAAELDAARCAHGVGLRHLPEVDMLNDLDETAALMTALDLVISTPTTVSILAAALGIETWQMTYGYDWQAHGTGRNLWFPTMRQFWRRWDERWNDVVSRMAPEFVARVKASER
jgi:tetratricopeptide (TPR) repeat protein